MIWYHNASNQVNPTLLCLISNKCQMHLVSLSQCMYSMSTKVGVFKRVWSSLTLRTMIAPNIGVSPETAHVHCRFGSKKTECPFYLQQSTSKTSWRGGGGGGGGRGSVFKWNIVIWCFDNEVHVCLNVDLLKGSDAYMDRCNCHNMVLYNSDLFWNHTW